MLYEVVNGRVVEKIVGASEVKIAAILDQYLGMFARTHRLGRVVMEMIEVLQLGQDLDGGELAPGFRLPLAALFEDDPE
jgi:hypothetical protein